MRKLARQLARGRDLQRRGAKLDAAKTWRNALALGLRHPRFLWGSVRSAWAIKVLPDINRFASRVEGASFRVSLLAFGALVARRPFTALFLVLPRIRIRSSESDSGSDASESAANPAPQPTPDPAEAPGLDGLDGKGDPLDLAEREILDQQAIAAAERKIDASLFTGRDRDEDRFVRLQLQNTVHRFSVPGAPDLVETVVFEPRLLLHESGIAQLSVRIDTEQVLTTDQVIAMMWGTAPRITRSELPDRLVERAGLKQSVAEWIPSRSGALTIGAIDHASPISIRDEVSMQLDAIGRTIGAQFPNHWSLYPTAFVQAGTCCAPKNWRRNHAMDVERIRLRFHSDQSDVRIDSDRDFSITGDHSLYVNLSAAVYFEWQHQPPQGISELFTTLIVEYGLLLFERLADLERAVAEFPLSESVLTARYREAVRLFAEMRQGDIRAGQARDMANHLLTDLGGEKIRRTIETALNLSGSAYATESATAAARQSFWLTVVGTAIAGLVAVPTLQNMIGKLAKPADPNAVPAGITEAASYLQQLGDGGPILTILALIAVVVAIRAAVRLAQFRPQSRRRSRRGYSWPTPINVQISHSDRD